MAAKRKRKPRKVKSTDKRVLDLQQQRLALRHDFGGKLAELNRQIVHLRQGHEAKLAVLDAAIAAVINGEVPAPVPTATAAPQTGGKPPPPVDPQSGGFVKIAGHGPLTHHSITVERAA